MRDFVPNMPEGLTVFRDSPEAPWCVTAKNDCLVNWPQGGYDFCALTSDLEVITVSAKNSCSKVLCFRDNFLRFFL